MGYILWWFPFHPKRAWWFQQFPPWSSPTELLNIYFWKSLDLLEKNGTVCVCGGGAQKGKRGGPPLPQQKHQRIQPYIEIYNLSVDSHLKRSLLQLWNSLINSFTILQGKKNLFKKNQAFSYRKNIFMKYVPCWEANSQEFPISLQWRKADFPSYQTQAKYHAASQ